MGGALHLFSPARYYGGGFEATLVLDRRIIEPDASKAM
jgi:hypothetical protein